MPLLFGCGTVLHSTKATQNQINTDILSENALDLNCIPFGSIDRLVAFVFLHRMSTYSSHASAEKLYQIVESKIIKNIFWTPMTVT